MARINLLPWRAEQRKERQKDFGLLLGGFAGVGLVVLLVLFVYHNSLIDKQNRRNKYLGDEIVVLENQIKEIEALEKEKQRLVDRMKAIESLQTQRPLIVRFFDELIKALPDNVSVNSIEQQNETISIKGEADSNARVSSLMNNLEASEWLQNPEVSVIEGKESGQLRVSRFEMTFGLVVPKAEGEEEQDAKPAGKKDAKKPAKRAAAKPAAGGADS
jgi:type IV pilus assembly protein PilN